MTVDCQTSSVKTDASLLVRLSLLLESSFQVRINTGQSAFVLIGLPIKKFLFLLVGLSHQCSFEEDSWFLEVVSYLGFVSLLSVPDIGSLI